MIYEFAFEPALVASWHDRRAYRFFKGKLGPGTPRVLCRYPDLGKKRKWRQHVMRALDELGLEGVARDNARRNLGVLLSHLEGISSKRNHTCWDNSLTWLECVLSEHTRRPFQGIVVRETQCSSRAPVYAADALDEEHTTWNPLAPVIERTGEGVVGSVQALLRHARHIHLVDPYFDAAVGGDWREPLRLLIQQAQQERESDESICFVVHLSIDREFNGSGVIQSPSNEKAKGQTILDDLRGALGGVLTKPSSLKARIWSQRGGYRGTERLHNRYILTEAGGVMFGVGLDAGRGSDMVALLSRPQWERCREVYHENDCTFRLVAEETFNGT